MRTRSLWLRPALAIGLLSLGACSHIIDKTDMVNATVAIDIPKTNDMLICLAKKLGPLVVFRDAAGHEKRWSIGVGTFYDQSGAQTPVFDARYSSGPHPSTMSPYFIDTLSRMVVFDLKRPNPPELFSWPKVTTIPEHLRPTMLLTGGIPARDEVRYDSANANVSLGGLELVADGSQSWVQVSVTAMMIEPATGEIYRATHRKPGSGQRVQSMAHTKITIKVPVTRAALNLIAADFGAGTSAKYGPMLHETLAFAADVAVFDLLRRLFDIDAQACMGPDVHRYVTSHDYGIALPAPTQVGVPASTAAVNAVAAPRPASASRHHGAVTAVAGSPRMTLSGIDGIAFKSGDRLQFNATVSTDAYLACFYQDEAAQVTRVYPVANGATGRVGAGRPVSIPAATGPFDIDLLGPATHGLLCVADRRPILPRLSAGLRRGDLAALPVASLDALLTKLSGALGSGMTHSHRRIQVSGR